MSHALAATLAAISARAVDIRRALHAHPELMWQEHTTAAVVRAELDRLGIPWQACADTGTLGRLGENKPGRHLAFRADLDALPLDEATGLPWASTKPGCMHACGHDGHTASLLAAAAYLKSREDELPGPITLLFQPAEEGGHGAQHMIDAGALNGIDAIFGYHNWPPLPFGSAACPLGPVMAANAEWTIVITGRGAHASTPQDGIDPIVCGAQFVSAVQQVVSRCTAPQDAAVVTVTCFHAGTADNIIPDAAELIGTVRAGTTEQRDALAAHVERILHATATACGATATFDYRPCYPATVNHAAEAEIARAAIRSELGSEQLIDAGMPLMAAEDFGAFLRVKPGAFLLLGAGRPGQQVEGCHSPRFDFNDDLIPLVARLWARLAGLSIG